MGRIIPFPVRSAPHICPVCFVSHTPRQMHDYLSKPYIERFRSQYGRAPTPKDAMAHCSPEVQQYWRQKFNEYGIEV